MVNLSHKYGCLYKENVSHVMTYMAQILMELQKMCYFYNESIADLWLVFKRIFNLYDEFIALM